MLSICMKFIFSSSILAQVKINTNLMISKLADNMTIFRHQRVWGSLNSSLPTIILLFRQQIKA